jgi:hypothetical protein
MRVTEAAMNDLQRGLAAYGADLSRWPRGAAEARAALLADPGFRRRWEAERPLDGALTAERDALDAEIARSGAVARLARLAARRTSAGFLADIPWRRVAAGVILAGMVGSVLDLILPGPASDPVEVALFDPLAGVDGADIR